MDHSHLALSWVALAMLGAFHGLNPATGWLFAVSLGFQERRTGAVVRALGPIAAGHLLAIGAVAVPVALLQVVVPTRGVMIAGGVLMIGYAAYKVVTRFRHPRWIGMRVTSRELVSWSALMATAHGAGLMLIPALAELSRRSTAEAMAGSMPMGHDPLMLQAMDHMDQHASSGSELSTALMAVSLHTLSMLVVMGVVAVLVYRWIGVGMLRRAWINLDLIWVGALAMAGGLTLGIALWP